MKAKSQGLEAEVEWRQSRNLTMGGILSRRIFAPGYHCGVVPGTGGVGQPAAACGCDLSGKQLLNAAKYQGALFARYDISLPGGSTLTPTLTPTLVASFSSGSAATGAAGLSAPSLRPASGRRNATSRPRAWL